MGCSTSKDAATLLAAHGGSSAEFRGSVKGKKCFGKSHSFAPLRSSRGGGQFYADCKPMHFDYHVVALTSSTYGIMKLVEAENVNDELVDLKNDIVSATAAAAAPTAAVAAAAGPMYFKMRKSESMPARSCSYNKAPQTWTDMAMGISRMTTSAASPVAATSRLLVSSKELNRDHEDKIDAESVKTPPFKNAAKSWTAAAELQEEQEQEQEEELETINTWELMAGLDDLTPRPSPLLPPPPALAAAAEAPVAVVAESHADSLLQQQNLESAVALEARKKKKLKSKTLSRSRSLSSMEDLIKVATDAAELEDDVAAADLTMQQQQLGKTTAATESSTSARRSKAALFSKFASAAAWPDQEAAAGCTSYCTRDDDDDDDDNSCATTGLFDPEILASFAASCSADGRTDTATSESDESWCRDAMTSSSASFADEDVTSQWITTAAARESARSPVQQDIRNEESAVWRSSSPDRQPTRASSWSKLSFAKIAPHDLVGDSATTVGDSGSGCRGLAAFERKCPPGGYQRVVLYSTSLRGIRKTFEDCNRLRSILHSYHVWIDERDVSMHADFRQELKLLLLPPTSAAATAQGPGGGQGAAGAAGAAGGGGTGTTSPPQIPSTTGTGPTGTAGTGTGGVFGTVRVPRVFIMGHYIGELEEVLQLHEDGELGELLVHLAPQPHPTSCCDGCGGIRFVPCPDCRGSCKMVNALDNRITRCPDCNENGLIRCPICF